MNDALRHPLFKQIGAIADAKGLQAFVIGGYVRDHFLHRPCTDIDIVVVGSGIEVAEDLEDAVNRFLKLEQDAE